MMLPLSEVAVPWPIFFNNPFFLLPQTKKLKYPLLLLLGCGGGGCLSATSTSGCGGGVSGGLMIGPMASHIPPPPKSKTHFLVSEIAKSPF
jgi:hypothetical protein